MLQARVTRIAWQRICTSARSRLFGLALAGLCAGMLGSASQVGQAQGTQRRMTPTASYYTIFGEFYDGDYHTALKGFQSESRGSIKNAQSRWIDSICYETMCGECYYAMGVFDKALVHYTNALQLFTRFPDWMVKVQFSPTIQATSVGARKAVPWGVTGRQSRLGSYPTSVLMAQGQVDLNETIKRGGVVQQAHLYPITPQEIIRCTTLAMRRRAQILGPVSKNDPLTAEVASAMTRTLGPPNHWSECWIDLERALALIASGREGQAMSYLQRSVMAAGEFDHPMTCIALLELGRQKLLRSDYPAALKFFEEATFAAVNYGQWDILEEAFRFAALTHLLSNSREFYAPLLPAIQWAKTKNMRQLRASLQLCAAENYAVLGETRQAAAMLEEVRATIGRRKMGAGAIGARMNYLAAVVAFQQRRVPEGSAALTAALGYMQHGSLWLFHIGLVDGLFMSGTITPRVALDLYGEVLRDPLPADWAMEPLESLAVLSTPHPLPLEHWFEAALERKEVKEVQAALEIAERARRHRFFTSLEFGGRLESLRWILEAAPEQLPKTALLQRQDILNRYPLYAELSQKARAIRAELGKEPLASEDPAVGRKQTQQLNDLAAVGAQQEAILREIAVRREPVAMVFPPLRSLAEVQKSLPERQAILSFFATSRRLYGFLLNNQRCAHWHVPKAPALFKQMQTMLREMGNFSGNYELAVKDVTDVKWKQSAEQVLKLLLEGSLADFSQPFDELVIVPDGALWYLPFEALQVSVDGQLQPLISRFRIRYAPTLSLCNWTAPSRGAAGNTAVVIGKLFPRHDDSVARQAFEQLASVVPGAFALKAPAPAATALFSTLFHRLIVFDDLPGLEAGGYGWSPAALDRGKPGSTLAEWLWLPWGGPELIVLPGYHTIAEESLKRVPRQLAGNEIFLPVCGLMANGARTVLISRWRTGGQTSFDLVREFVQELPRTSAADAWQRAVLLTVESRLNLDAEPRIKKAANTESPKADSPFFWAGYMLVDCDGALAGKQAAEEDNPVLKPKKEEKDTPPKVAPEQPRAKPIDPTDNTHGQDPSAVGEPPSVPADGAIKEKRPRKEKPPVKKPAEKSRRAAAGATQ